MIILAVAAQCQHAQFKDELLLEAQSKPVYTYREAQRERGERDLIEHLHHHNNS
jgi:hypothetical protein